MACNCSNSTSIISYLCTEPSCPSCNCCANSCSCNSASCSTDSSVDSSLVKYSGPNLTCLDIDTGATVEEVIQAIDGKVCSVAGVDYSTFNIASCIRNADSSQITTPQQFAERISLYVCDFKTTYNTFVTNYNTFVTNISNLVTTASVAGITGTCTSIASTDTQAQAFAKIDNAICTLQGQLNPSDNPWNSCGFTTGSLPTNPSSAFGVILNYLCTLKGMIPATVTLPTFNNTGSCLGGTLTTTDTLFNTVEKIKTKLCGLDSINVATLTYGCVTTATTYQTLIQNILTRINLFDQWTFDPTYFTVSLTSSGNACGGKSVTINTSGLDQKVKSNNADVSPGTLFDKLQAGTNITLDYTTTAGKVILNVPTSTGDHKVLVNGSDGAAGYLDAKIDGVADVSGALTLAATTDGGNTKVVITPTFDNDILSDNVLTAIQNNPTLLAKLCQLVCSCNCDNCTVQFSVYSDGTHSVQFTANQNTPALSWYNTGAITISTATVNSGTYPITDTSTNPQITVTLKNNGAVPMTAHIYVKDLAGVIVPSSTNVTASAIAASATYTNATVNLGVGTTAYVVHVDIT